MSVSRNPGSISTPSPFFMSFAMSEKLLLETTLPDSSMTPVSLLICHVRFPLLASPLAPKPPHTEFEGLVPVEVDVRVEASTSFRKPPVALHIAELMTADPDASAELSEDPRTTPSLSVTVQLSPTITAPERDSISPSGVTDEFSDAITAERFPSSMRQPLELCIPLFSAPAEMLLSIELSIELALRITSIIGPSIWQFSDADICAARPALELPSLAITAENAAGATGADSESLEDWTDDAIPDALDVCDETTSDLSSG